MEVAAAENKPWFIDAWAVHDGKAFASRRPAESIAADATVFMSVPDLEAVPVGRISTALRATRSGFQQGLRSNDSNAAEIPFQNLRQVRDLVRRAYLAASLGPGSPGAIAGPLPRPDIDHGPGSTFVRLEITQQRPWPPIDLSAALPPPDLEHAVHKVAQATILEWDGRLASQDPDEIRGLVGWLSALSGAGILQGLGFGRSGALYPNSMLELAGRYDAWHLHEALQLIGDRWRPDLAFELGSRISGYWSRSHLASVPLPVAPGWHAKVRRLADMSLLPVLDRRFWTSDHQPVTSLSIAPLVLWRAIRQPARSGRLPGEQSAVQIAYERARASMKWYQEIELPSAAESVLAEFIDACLAGPSTEPPGGAPRPTEPPEPTGPIGSGPDSPEADPGAAPQNSLLPAD